MVDFMTEMQVAEWRKDVAGVGEPSALKENTSGGIGLKFLPISEAEHKAGEEHMLEVGGHDAPGKAEKKLEHLTAVDGGIREKG